MKLWKRNAVVAAIVLFVCAAVYLNWSYNQEAADAGKVLGQAALVGAESTDPLLTSASPSPAPSGQAGESPAPSGGEEGASGGTGYFDSARLNRQEARDSALNILQESAGDAGADEAMQTQLAQAIETMAGAAVSEAQIENLVTAKGYADCVAFISENSASVVVPATEEGLTDADVARITEIVTGETGLAASQIKIIEAQP